MSNKLTDTQKQAIASHMNSLKAIQETFKTVTIDFNDIVINAVKLLWDNGQISVVNRTMATLKHMKGADNRALVTYFLKCIPHTFDKEKGVFGKKNDMTANKMEGTWAEFILNHDWFEESKTKDSKPYVLDVAKLALAIDKGLDKGEEAGNQVTLEALTNLSDAINVVVNKHLDRINANTKMDETPETGDIQLDEAIKQELKAVG